MGLDRADKQFPLTVPHGKVFHHQVYFSSKIGVCQINRIYKGIAKKAGLDESIVNGISGHSMRVGAAQDLLNSGASMPIIMQRGRWSKPDKVMRHVEYAHPT